MCEGDSDESVPENLRPAESETMPFGGVGYSGIGHYYGKAGFDALTHAKSVLISPPDVAIEHLFPPYTGEKVKALSQWFEY
jgi:aldehyde dehydrogenase (NAD+)